MSLFNSMIDIFKSAYRNSQRYTVAENSKNFDIKSSQLNLKFKRLFLHLKYVLFICVSIGYTLLLTVYQSNNSFITGTLKTRPTISRPFRSVRNPLSKRRRHCMEPPIGEFSVFRPLLRDEMRSNYFFIEWIRGLIAAKSLSPPSSLRKKTRIATAVETVLRRVCFRFGAVTFLEF